ncbi:peptidoglycan-binding protein [Streptomyces sp. NPDC052040]|uniref:peptidoglycan-binding protein n=1 Tax=Streptomyces sp. NPDC052040 TaxID=3365682 RepID=UPI0037D61298
MSRWNEVPDSLDEPGRQLVIQLRRLKDRSGLSLMSLQSRTGCSRSSWKRYLNGQALPPRQAVKELARAANVEPTQLLVLHDVAGESWRRAAEEPAAADGTAPGGPLRRGPRGLRRAVPVGVFAAAVLGALLIGLLVVAPWMDDESGGSGPVGAAHTMADPSGQSFAYAPGRTYPCTVRREKGLLYAGYSSTRSAVLSQSGWEVVEAQCLLRHRGFDPGGADGVYGENTTRAVKRLQQRAGLPADGIVGPHTWQVLRG